MVQSIAEAIYESEIASSAFGLLAMTEQS